MAGLVTKKRFGQIAGGPVVDAYILQGKNGVSLQAITLGGIVTHLYVPDRDGRLRDVVLGFSDLESYLKPHPYFGAITGRVAGRITGSAFTLDGQRYSLAENDSPNHLHGGERGFDKQVWNAEISEAHDAPAVSFSRLSPDGEEHYPGNVNVRVTYSITPKNEFVITSEASTDRATPLSLTHHSYFNLSGEGSGSIEQHELQLRASHFAPADAKFGLLGSRERVGANDFRNPKRLAEVIPNLHGRHGDLYFVDSPPGPRELIEAARLYDPASGITMTVRTDEPCLQLYTGVGLNGTLVGKSGRLYQSLGGVCLECEGYPDGANHPELGDIILRPGATLRRTTIYAFSTV